MEACSGQINEWLLKDCMEACSGRALHFGDIWEVAVTVLKTLLAKVVGSCILIVEEIYTVLADIEATMNSRPLITPEASPIDRVSVLTPGHYWQTISGFT